MLHFKLAYNIKLNNVFFIYKYKILLNMKENRQ